MQNGFALLLILICVWVLPFNSAAAEISSIDITALSVQELLSLQDSIKNRLEELGHQVYYDIERGSKGEEVSAIQARLAELGYYTGKNTGKYDAETQKSFKLFEKANQLANDGLPSRNDQIVLFGNNVVPKVSPSPTPHRTADYSETEKKQTAAIPDFHTEITSCWTANTGLNGVTLYVPYLKVRVTNQRGRDAGKITVDVVFFDKSSKELWDEESYSLIRTGDTSLKNGYSKTAYIKSSVGYKSKISQYQLPVITAEVYINGVLYDEVTVDNTYN